MPFKRVVCDDCGNEISKEEISQERFGKLVATANARIDLGDDYVDVNSNTITYYKISCPNCRARVNEDEDTSNRWP